MASDLLPDPIPAERDRWNHWVTLGWLAVLALGYLFLVLIHPLVTSVFGMTLALVGLSMLPLTALVFRRVSTRDIAKIVACYGVFFGVIYGSRQVNFDPRAPFVRAFDRIRPGMALTDVDAIFRKEFRGTKLPTRMGEHNDAAVSYFLDLDDGHYNSEIVWVHLQQGLVINASYHPD